MKANEIVAPGYYWCTHDLERIAVDDSRFPREWQVVMFEDGILWRTGTEISTHVSEAPEYVEFFGPLEPPNLGG
ncbi:hypothetical protein FHS47_000900 [Lutibacter sp. SG786]|nr:hypothetical protein [Luteibacter sp. SG786]